MAFVLAVSSFICFFSSFFFNVFSGMFSNNILLDVLFTGAQESKNINIVEMNNMDKGLYIVSTPIGNLDDIGLRAKEVLTNVDMIICENPVHSLKLLNKLGIKKKLLSLHDYNESVLIKRIEKYQNNSTIALISDAGSPLISDPGYNLVLDYIKKNIKITTIPGPSSIIPALQMSGLPINNFTFLGFISKKSVGMDNVVAKINGSPNTILLFISGNRIIKFLEKFSKSKICRKIAVCKELTKINEKVIRGNSKEVIEKLSSNKNYIKGEFVLVVEGMQRKDANKLDTQTIKQIEKLLKKFSLTEVVQIVHKLTNISKKEIYNAALLFKNE